ncbi:FkbM family methyltransferase [Sediminibacterium roseum]|uniref:FkbM family methyltransferase n=1 Tax=Sediminibacterium roseum TaxID=1978412 RepID=A0ABW9ZPA7_9BACT|nr:FkbM family methyltransferase [Sediminibacterium roseum]NCI48360.1 FkbM family methyltransferase [Sediminibacterium roseum]
MAIFNKNHLRISVSNMARSMVYRGYLFYQKWVSPKLPVYDMQVAALIGQLPQNAVCIDVGVNEAQLFSRMVKRCTAGMVYGFEPIPELFSYLQKKFPGRSVKLFNCALSDTNGEASFYSFKRTGVSGLSKRRGFLGDIEGKTIRTKIASLDALLSLPRIDLIKIDVEGAELKMLTGAREHIARCRPVVVFECQHSGLDFFDTTPAALFDFFYELGYGISLTSYFLRQQPPLNRQTLLNLTEHRYEYQFVAWPLLKGE